MTTGSTRNTQARITLMTWSPLATTGLLLFSIAGLQPAAAANCGATGQSQANQVNLIGFPCQPHGTVGSVLGDDFGTGRYGWDWSVFRWNRMTEDHERLSLSDALSQNEGYWLYSRYAKTWDIDSPPATDTPLSAWPGCHDAINGCYRIDLTPPADPGDSRLNLVGHPLPVSIPWEDVTLVVDPDMAYAPFAAEQQGLMSKTFWAWNGNAHQAMDDVTPAMTGSLEPFSGFWVKVLGGAIGKNPRLLIPGAPVNDPPIAEDDDFITDEDTPISGNVLQDNGHGKDRDPEGDALTVIEVDTSLGTTPVDPNPAVGTMPILPSGALLTIHSDGVFDYDPNGQFDEVGEGDSATDSFDYTIKEASGTLTASATVTISIDGINDPPEADDASFTVNEFASAATVVGTVAATDPDTGDQLAYAITAGNTGGAFAINANNGEITVASSAALDPNANPSFSLTVEVTDDATTPLSGTATITIDINEAPTITTSAAVNVDENETLVIDINSTDPDGDTEGAGLTYSLTGGADQSKFTIDPNTGELSFLTAPDFENPSDANTDNDYLVQVTVTDSGGLTDVQDMVVTVDDVAENTPPVLTLPPLSASVPELALFSFTAAANDTDVPAQNLTFSLEAGTGAVPSGASINPTSGLFQWTPAENQGGPAGPTYSYTFDVVVKDDGSPQEEDRQTVTVAVSEVNQAPAVGNLSHTNIRTLGNVPASIPDSAYDLLSTASDSDVPAQTLTVSGVSNVTAGAEVSVTNASTGTFKYTPPPGFTGDDTFTFSIFDGVTTTNATATVHVDGPAIWFVSTGGSDVTGNGTLEKPFATLTPLAPTDGSVDGNGHAIFLYTGSYNSGITLQTSQKLIGQGVDGTSLAAVLGIATVPLHSAALPTIGGTNPTITSSAAGSNGIVLGSGNTVRGLDIGNTGTAGSPGTGLLGNAFGTLVIDEVSISGIGNALSLTNGSIDGPTSATATFGALSSTAATTAVKFDTVGLDAVVITGGSISGSTVAAFDINAGSSNISYGGTITNSAGRLVEVTNRTGGTVTFSGALNSTGGTGIFLDNNDTGGSGLVQFSSTVDITNSTGTAVTLQNSNSGVTRFSNLDIVNSTSNQKGLFATNNSGGRLNVDTGTVNAGTATAVDIDNTELGNNSGTAAGLSLVSVRSVNGTAPGIDLANTTGALSVLGSGGDCKNVAAQCSGGEIANKSGAGDGVDGILLNAATNVQLSHMNIHNNNRNGLYATGGNGLVLNQTRFVENANQASPDEAGILIDGLQGSAPAGANPTKMTDVRVQDSFEHNVIVRHTSGTLTNLEVQNSLFTNDGGSTQAGNNFIVDTGGTANVTVNVTGSAFNGSTIAGMLTAFGFVGDAADTSTLSANVSTSTFDKNNVGLSASVSNGANMSFNYSNNSTITGHPSNAINLFANASHTGTFSGTVSNNTIGTAGTTGSGSVNGSGIRLSNEGGGTATVQISNNIVREIQNFEGIVVTNSVTASTTNATVTNNTVDGTDFDRGLTLNQTIAGGTLCANITGNNFLNITATTDLRVRQTAGTFNIVQTSAANLSAANNSAVISEAGTLTYNAAVCPTTTP